MLIPADRYGLLGKGVEEGRLAQEPEADEVRPEGPAVSLLGEQGLLELVVPDGPGRDQEFADFHFLFSHLTPAEPGSSGPYSQIYPRGGRNGTTIAE